MKASQSRWADRWRGFWHDKLLSRLDSPNAPQIALTIGATVCAGATLLALEAGRAEVRTRTDDSVAQVRRMVEGKFQEYVSLINIVRVMVDPSTPNPLEGLRGYLTGDALRQHYPAVSYIAFVRHVRNADLPSYEGSMRNLLMMDESGTPAFRPRPLMKRESYYFMEKAAPTAAIAVPPGTDLSDDPLIDRGDWIDNRSRTPLLIIHDPSLKGALPTPALAATVNNALARPGTDSVLGILVMGIDLSTLLQRGAAYDTPPGWQVRLFSKEADGRRLLRATFSPADGIADNASPWTSDAHIVSDSEILIGGQALTLQIAGTSDLTGGIAHLLPWTVLLTGMLLTAILYLLVRQIHDSRNSAEQLAALRWQQAEHSQQRFQDLVESSIDWIWEVDANMHIRYASPMTSRFFGIAPAALVGKSINILSGSRQPIFPFDPGSPRSYTNFERTLAGPNNGKVSTFESAGTAIYDEQGRFAGMRGIDRDITSKRQFRDSLARLREELADNMQANLVGQLLSGVAHELNQPLSAIVSYNQACIRLLESGGAAPGEIASAMRATASNALLAGDIVKRLRRLSARGAPQAHPTSIRGLIRNAIALVDHRLRSADIDVIVRTAAPVSRMIVDPVLMTQVMLNLLHNAADAISEAMPETRQIRVSCEDHENGKTRITVSDSGPGIPPETLKRIFEPHFTTKAHGTGIGLSISRSIVEAMGGTLECNSVPGKGASFTIELPAEKTHDDNEHPTG